MKIITSTQQMQHIINKNKHNTIGFIPARGLLHEGHLSLAKEARKDIDVVIMSIFVNQLQFGPDEDYDEYPRDKEHDINQAASVRVDYLFLPDVTEIYPQKMAITMT